jgi:hypothetical protein
MSREEMRKLMEAVSQKVALPSTPEEILQELKTTHRKAFRGTGADMWFVEDDWAFVGWPAGGGDSEFVCFRKVPKGYETTMAQYSDRADAMQIYEEDSKVLPTLADAVEYHWG